MMMMMMMMMMIRKEESRDTSSEPLAAKFRLLLISVSFLCTSFYLNQISNLLLFRDTSLVKQQNQHIFLFSQAKVTGSSLCFSSQYLNNQSNFTLFLTSLQPMNINLKCVYICTWKAGHNLYKKSTHTHTHKHTHIYIYIYIYIYINIELIHIDPPNDLSFRGERGMGLLLFSLYDKIKRRPENK